MKYLNTLDYVPAMGLSQLLETFANPFAVTEQEARRIEQQAQEARDHEDDPTY